MKQFEKKLRKICARKGISLAQFAQSVGLHEDSLYRYFSGTRTPSAETMERIFIATDREIEPNDYFDFEYKK